ncbi:MAG: hypothetical protein ABI977_13025 [Acidobacteriota bacterium]
MMYSQQEYDMVRRQTMQIEAEKRALLRWALIAVTVLFAASLVLSGLMYQRYSSSESTIEAAQTRATNAEAQLQQAIRERDEKIAQLEKYAAVASKQSTVIDSIVPRMLNTTAPESELAELAHAVYNQPGHMIQVPGIPPNTVLRSFRYRVDGRPNKYTFVPGLIDGKWVLYSVLVKNQDDK